jgi:putative salt-induced outer membrane protein
VFYRCKLKWASLGLGLLLCAHGFADPCVSKSQNKPPAKPQKFKGSIQAGGVINTGNSDNKNFNSKIAAQYQTARWQHTATIEGQLNRSKGETTAESILFNGETRFSMSPRNYMFGKGSTGYDRFATYDLTFKYAAGLGRVFIKTPRIQLRLEAGPGGSHSRIAGTDQYQNEFISNLNGELKFKISEITQFKQTANADLGQRNTHIKAVSSLKTKMTHNLALELSYTVEHDTKIPSKSSNPVKTDTLTKIAVVYDF